MAKEIERKFLVTDPRFLTSLEGVYYRQGYIPTLTGITVRVRLAGATGYLTLKDHAVGFTRHEYEYAIPAQEAEEMMDLLCAHPQIAKRRYVLPATGGRDGATGAPVEGLHWEVDVFEGDNAGLIVAEIEVPAEDTLFDRPAWLGEEVTGDRRYYNSSLTRYPYKDW